MDPVQAQDTTVSGNPNQILVRAGPHSTSNGRQSPVDPSMWWWAKTDSRWRYARPDRGQDERRGRRHWRFIGLVATTGSILAGICQSLQCSLMVIGLLEGCWRFTCGPLAGLRGVVLGVHRAISDRAITPISSPRKASESDRQGYRISKLCKVQFFLHRRLSWFPSTVLQKCSDTKYRAAGSVERANTPRRL